MVAPLGPTEQQRGNADTPLNHSSATASCLIVLLIFTFTQVLQCCDAHGVSVQTVGQASHVRMKCCETTHHQSDRVRAQIRQSMQTGASILASQLCIRWSSLMNRLWQTEPCQRQEDIIEGQY